MYIFLIQTIHTQKMSLDSDKVCYFILLCTLLFTVIIHAERAQIKYVTDYLD